MNKQMTPQAKSEVNTQPREVYTSAGEFKAVLVDGGSLSTFGAGLTLPRQGRLGPSQP